MVDNRSAGVLGIGGAINFKSGDISGTAAKTADDRASQGTEYFMQEGEEQFEQERFVDRSIRLQASLNSLALLNVATVLKNKKKNYLFDDEEYVERMRSESVTNPISKKEKNKDNKKKN